MAFTRGLYYPSIDIRSEAWLKNAALYWDSLSTIVPVGFEQPYATPTSRRLADEGILESFVINSGEALLNRLTEDVIEYLETPEGFEVLAGEGRSRLALMHYEKLPPAVSEFVQLHPEKLPYEVRWRLEQALGPDDWMVVDHRFAAFYMTLLASTIAAENGLALVTEVAPADRLANKARLGLPSGAFRLGRAGRQRYRTLDGRLPSSRRFAEGMLADLVIRGIRIDRRTSLTKIIQFRRSYVDEIGRLRTEIGRLCSAIDDVESFEALQQTVSDLYTNELRPAQHAFEQALTSARIRWYADNVLKVAFFGIPAASLPLAVAGLPATIAVLAGAGVSLAVSEVAYALEKRDKLANSPFAVLLAAEDLRRRGTYS